MSINNGITPSSTRNIKRMQKRGSPVQQKCFPFLDCCGQTDLDSNMQSPSQREVGAGSPASQTKSFRLSATRNSSRVATANSDQKQKITTVSSTRSGFESLKTSKLAQKLGELAVANDLAYVPRMPDKAIIGVNGDEMHSRESYLQTHNDAISFARHLPKGVRPGYYNPATHLLVPLQSHQRHHTLTGLQARPTGDGKFDLLDLEFMPEKSKTVPALLPSDQTRREHNSESEQTSSQTSPHQLHRLPAGDGILSPERTVNSLVLSTERSSKARISAPFEATLPDFAHINNTQSKKVAAARSTELFYSRLPTPQQHPTINVRSTQQEQSTPAVKATSNKKNPTSQQVCELNEEAPITFAPEVTPNTKPLRKALPPILTHTPPATWAGPSNRHHLVSPETLATSRRKHQSTMGSIKERQITTQPRHDDVRPRTPPFTLKNVKTFCPQQPYDATLDSPADLTRSKSQQQRKKDERKRRDTSIYRKKTSQEIWDDEASSAAVSEQDAVELQPQREAEEEEQKRQQKQQQEKEEFERRHQERLRRMQQNQINHKTDMVVDLEKERARLRKTPEMVNRREAEMQSRNQNHMRPTARTFQLGRDEHRLRTLRGTHDLRATARTFHPLDEETPEQSPSPSSPSQQLRRQGRETTSTPTHAGHVQTSENSYSTYTIQSRYTYQQQQQQPSTSTSSQQRKSSRQTPEEARGWSPNPAARTFEIERGYEHP